MRKLMILFGILLLLLLMIVLVMPYFVGRSLESQFHQRIQKILTQSAKNPYFSLKTDYQRGWFASKAHVDLTLNLNKISPAIFKKPVTIMLEENISHGPVIWKNGQLYLALGMMDGQLVLTPQQKQFLKAYCRPLPQIRLESFVTLTGKELLHNTVEPFAYHNQNFFQKLDGVTSHITRRRGTMMGLTDIKGWSMRYQPKHLHVTLGPTTITSEHQHISSTHKKLQANIAISSVTVQHKKVVQFTLSQLHYEMGVLLRDQLLDYQTAVKIKQATMGPEKFGPLQMALTLKGVHYDVLQARTKAIKDVPISEFKQRQKADDEYWPKILQGSSLVVQTFRLETPDGLIQTDGQLGFSAKPTKGVLAMWAAVMGQFQVAVSKKIAETTLNYQNLQAVLMRYKKQVSSTVTPVARKRLVKEAANMTQEKLSTMLREKKLKVVGGNYLATVSIRAGNMHFMPLK